MRPLVVEDLAIAGIPADVDAAAAGLGDLVPLDRHVGARPFLAQDLEAPRSKSDKAILLDSDMLGPVAAHPGLAYSGSLGEREAGDCDPFCFRDHEQRRQDGKHGVGA